MIHGVVGKGLALACSGMLIGMIGARFATKLIQGMLHEVPSTDTLSFAIAAVILIATATIACVVPARRALEIDPITAIRAE